jgi:hypothetical protein
MNKVYQLFWITSLMTGLTRHKTDNQRNKLYKDSSASTSFCFRILVPLGLVKAGKHPLTVACS